eukprot:2581298-Alexandrium_andersonii.AAC.1
MRARPRLARSSTRTAAPCGRCPSSRPARTGAAQSASGCLSTNSPLSGSRPALSLSGSKKTLL